MPANKMPAVSQGDVATLSLDAFKGQFNVTSLIDMFALPVLKEGRQNKATGPNSGAERPKEVMRDSVQVTEQLLKQFDR